MNLLNGKCGLVTGAGSGIGRASAITSAKEGAKVMVSDILESGIIETVKIIEESGGIAQYCSCDISKEEDVKKLIDATISSFGKIDFAHNNAGISNNPSPLTNISNEEFDKVMKVDVYGTYYCIKHEFLAMKKTGGSIVNTVSGTGMTGVGNLLPYATAKAGVINMTRAAAMEGGPLGIRVNSISPGTTMTPTLESYFQMLPEQELIMASGVPMGRLCKPEEQADAVVFLISDKASMITGLNLSIDGGALEGQFSK